MTYCNTVIFSTYYSPKTNKCFGILQNLQAETEIFAVLFFGLGKQIFYE